MFLRPLQDFTEIEYQRSYDIWVVESYRYGRIDTRLPKTKLACNLDITTEDYLRAPLAFRYRLRVRWDAGRPKRWWTEQDEFVIQRKALKVPTLQSVVVVVIVVVFVFVVVVVMSYIPTPFDVNRFPDERVSNCCEVYRSGRWCGSILLIWYICPCMFITTTTILPLLTPSLRWDGWDLWHALGEKWNTYRILGLKAWREEITGNA